MDTLSNYLSTKEIETLIINHPEILKIPSESIDANMREFIDCNLNPKTISTIVFAVPEVLKASPESIRDIIELISKYTNDIDNILEEFPEALRFSKEDLEEQMKYADDIDIEKILANFITDY